MKSNGDDGRYEPMFAVVDARAGHHFNIHFANGSKLPGLFVLDVSDEPQLDTDSSVE